MRFYIQLINQILAETEVTNHQTNNQGDVGNTVVTIVVRVTLLAIEVKF